MNRDDDQFIIHTKLNHEQILLPATYLKSISKGSTTEDNTVAEPRWSNFSVVKPRWHKITFVNLRRKKPVVDKDDGRVTRFL